MITFRLYGEQAPGANQVNASENKCEGDSKNKMRAICNVDVISIVGWSGATKRADTRTKLEKMKERNLERFSTLNNLN